MDIASTIPYGESSIHSCDYCGAEIEVNITKQSGHNEPEDYYCPECNKKFSTWASVPIRDIVLLKKRTDGKNDRYQN